MRSARRKERGVLVACSIQSVACGEFRWMLAVCQYAQYQYHYALCSCMLDTMIALCACKQSAAGDFGDLCGFELHLECTEGSVA